MFIIKDARGAGVRRPLDGIKDQEFYRPWGGKDVRKEAVKKSGPRGGYEKTYLPEPLEKEVEKVWEISVKEDSPWGKIDCFGMTFERSPFFPITELGVPQKQASIIYILTDSQMEALRARLDDKKLTYQDNQAGETRVYTAAELVEIFEIPATPADFSSNIVSQRELSGLQIQARRREEVKK